MLRFIKSRYFFPLLLILISIPASRFLFSPGQYWNMQDDMQIVRQLEFDKCLKDGQIPCRWVPDLGYGYGYPLFNFYPPLPSIIGQVFRFIGLPYMETVKAGAALHFFLAALSMYFFLKDLYKHKLSAIFGSIFYVYAPYRALNIYVRGAMNEAWASVFFPLIFLFSKKIIQKPSLANGLYLSLSISGLLLSHNAMAMIFFPFIGLWIIYWLIQSPPAKRLKNIISLALSGLFGLALSSFFTLPVVFETKYVQINTMFQNYFSYLAHFKSLNQIFISNYWGDGPSVWGGGDGMSFMVGYLHWLLPLSISLIFIYFLVVQKKYFRILLIPSLLCLSGYVCLFFIHGRSAPLWNLITPIQVIQFPWRFLNPATFLLTASLSVTPLFLSKIFSKRISFFSLILVVAVIMLNISHFYPVVHGPLTDQQKFSGIAWRNLITAGIYDYLPKTARIAALRPAHEYVDEASPPITPNQITGSQHGTDWLLFNLSLDVPTQITLSQLAFPNFKVFDNNSPINYQIEPEFGRLVINLLPGYHQIYLKLFDTPIRLFSNWLSLVAWVFVFLYFFKSMWIKLVLKK